ncbi:MAG: phage tail protein [bacterium]
MTQTGELVYLKTVLVNTHVYGVVTDGDTPDMFSATFEITGDQGTITTNALVGPTGPAGQNSFALRLQKSVINDPEDLPQNLTDTDADFGKYWMIDDVDGSGNPIGSSAYIWFGTEFRRMMMGSPGPVGPVPIITPNVELLDPENANLSTHIDVTGSSYLPSWNMYLKVPRGPVGPSTSIGGAPDVDMTPGPTIGQVLGFNGHYNGAGEPIWECMSIGDIMPQPFTVPESAFQSFAGIATSRQTICTFVMPVQPWPWKPFVFGQIEVFGAELSLHPLQIGVEVRLGHPTTGVLVARGFGNTFGAVSFFPHTSSPTAGSNAMSPTNSYAEVSSHHTGTAGTLYVNLTNDGLVSVFDYNSANSQMSVLAIPVGSETAVGFGGS